MTGQLVTFGKLSVLCVTECGTPSNHLGQRWAKWGPATFAVRLAI
jgi:hypothetical protein